MKILAIHSNKIFFQENAPNVYEFLAKKRERSDDYERIQEIYYQNKQRAPAHLAEMFEVVATGLFKEEFIGSCHEYWENFHTRQRLPELRKLRESFERIYIFTSLPIYIYDELKHFKMIDRIFGVELEDDGSEIVRMKPLELKHPDAIRERFEKMGLKNEFTLEPNRYGLLGSLVDEMIEYGTQKRDVTVVGSDTTALPLHTVSTRQAETLEKLLYKF